MKTQKRVEQKKEKMSGYSSMGADGKTREVNTLDG